MLSRPEYFRLTSPRRAAALIATMCGAGTGLPSAALGAREPDEPPVLTAEVAEMEVLEGPQNLPGSITGDRERPSEEPGTRPEGETPAEARDWFGTKTWWEWEQATGDWAGFRTRLEDAGLSFAGSYTFDLQGAWSGGVDQRSTYDHLLDFNATLDLERAFGIKGGSVYVDFQSTAGDSPSRRIGDFHGTSNIEEAQSRDQVAELWYQQWLFDNVLRLKVGKVDGNKEFDFTEAGAEFLNTGAGLDTTNALLPCYPDPAMSVNLFVYPSEKWYIGFGFYDGAGNDGIRTGERGPATFFSDELSDDFFYTAETGVTFDTVWFIRDLRIAAGVWHHDGDFAEFDGGTSSGATGFYALSEANFWKADPNNNDDSRGLYGFFRYGHAEEDISAAVNALGAGLKLQGTFETRDDDSAGVFVGWTDLSDEDGAGFENDETVVEVYYRMNVTPFIHVVPDIQFIFDSNGGATEDTVVGGVRVSIDF